ncbi:BZ3500_MvSof-1268-A1-R1_Chr6-3g08770 [Microbotryum saponariae]|uniref:BZ3500_MvSof-1268-A1-R1_Chr6-3g08765 protein n=1 Tax=Microbotryum saponariae TaxID=289078 RepID=A0A2X0NMH3_9BASI|nr:BZ3500_MvSof-1268-A1-R1_Chr6-3g08765 [Microbotryum saponariae]SCZ93610.1 BZ3500_MvSof-1268-A1-R1_Chr6-3g08770 [Microbotryum saponariae]SDA07366.1 BZ3501_MvSof-1269-A2-R1_Chr6-2g08468 [Microbotryum saponariae]SDA07371.1 BZ3501_MvSof-1269-A2-R1_Chr6-2g08473 [Microbotryum saponariae]
MHAVVLDPDTLALLGRSNNVEEIRVFLRVSTSACAVGKFPNFRRASMESNDLERTRAHCLSSFFLSPHHRTRPLCTHLASHARHTRSLTQNHPQTNSCRTNMSLSLFPRLTHTDDDFGLTPFHLFSLRPSGQNSGAVRDQSELAFSPRVDVIEKDGKAEATFELAGLTKDQVKIMLDRGLLTVSGTVQSEDKREEGTWRVHERRTGSFERSIRVNTSLKAEDIHASMENGILKVEFPLETKETKAKAIKIS